MGDIFPDIFEDNEFGDTSLADEDDLLSFLKSLESLADFPPIDEAHVVGAKEFGEESPATRLVSQKSTSSIALQDQSGTELEITSSKSKRQKLSGTKTSSEETNQEGQHRISHITVERNRRKQMNDRLSVLRSLMPGFHVKRVSTS